MEYKPVNHAHEYRAEKQNRSYEKIGQIYIIKRRNKEKCSCFRQKEKKHKNPHYRKPSADESARYPIF